METRHYYHCANDGSKINILFASNEEYIAGMNRIAICCCLMGWRVQVIAFCLMDTHVHFLLFGTETDCAEFMANYKRLTEIWIGNHRDRRTTRIWDIGMWEIVNKEKFMEKIIYIHRNPIEAGMNFTPSCYLWSSGYLYFSHSDLISPMLSSVSSLSIHRQKEILNSKIIIPQDWKILSNGMIWPGEYVNYKLGMSYFDSARGYLYNLNKNVEEKVNMEILGGHISLHDSDVRTYMTTQSISLFGESDLGILPLDKKILICKKCHKEFGASTKQIARIIGLKYSELEQLI